MRRLFSMYGTRRLMAVCMRCIDFYLGPVFLPNARMITTLVLVILHAGSYFSFNCLISEIIMGHKNINNHACIL